MNSRNLKQLKARSKYVTEEVKIKNNALKFVASTFNYASAVSEARTFSKPNAHGFFAESLVEAQARFEGKSAEIMNSMGRSWKNRGDVMIDGEEVQVKVHATTESTYAALTDGHGGQRYLNDDGSNMKIAVASDQVEALRDKGLNVQSIGYTADELKNFHSSGAGIEWSFKDSFCDTLSSPSILFNSISDTINQDYVNGKADAFESMFFNKERVNELNNGSSRKSIEVIWKVCNYLLASIVKNATMHFLFGFVMNQITLISSYFASLFGFTTGGGIVFLGIVGVLVIGKFIFETKVYGFKEAVIELFKTALFISISILVSPILSGLIYSITKCKDKIVKYSIDFWNYLFSKFNLA